MSTDTNASLDALYKDLTVPAVAPEAPLETKAARKPYIKRVTPTAGRAASVLARPAISNPEIKALADAMDRQTDTLRQLADTRLPATSIKRQLTSLRQKRIADLREAVERRDRAVRARRPDPLLNDTIRRANTGLDQVNAEIKRLQLENARLKVKAARNLPGPVRAPASGYSAKSAAFAMYRKAVMSYLRTGQESFNGMSLRDLERRALHTESNPDGGYLVHPEHDTGPVERLLALLVPMRQVATVRPVTAAVFKKPFNLGGTAAHWVGERDSRPETDTPELVELEFPTQELYAKPMASQTMLEDGFLDMEGWLAEEVQTAFAEAEDLAYTAGNGVKKPFGLLAYPKVADANWAWGKIGYVVTGKSSAFEEPGEGANPADALMNLVYALRRGYRQNARFMMNRATIGTVRTLKDAEGRWIWRDSGELGEPDTLLGYPVVEAEQFPDIAADSYSIAFGDFAKTYLIVDRVGMSVLRDPYSSKPYVEFYTRKRVGGGVQNFESIKLLKFGST